MVTCYICTKVIIYQFDLRDNNTFYSQYQPIAQSQFLMNKHYLLKIRREFKQLIKYNFHSE